MERDKEIWLILASHVLRFATDHPYAATGIFGAAVGSAATYKVMQAKSMRQKANKVFTPKVYEFTLPATDLRRMLADCNYEIRWEIPEASVIVTAEKRESQKALPDIEYIPN